MAKENATSLLASFATLKTLSEAEKYRIDETTSDLSGSFDLIKRKLGFLVEVCVLYI